MYRFPLITHVGGGGGEIVHEHRTVREPPSALFSAPVFSDRLPGSSRRNSASYASRGRWREFVTVSTRDHCATCGTAIEQTGKGRPAKYCGTPCRRSAEYMIKRFTERIERMEDARDGLLVEKAKLVTGTSLMAMVAGNTLPDVDAHLSVLEERIAHYEGELLEALAD